MLQGTALVLHRTSQVLCEYPTSFAAHMMILVLIRIALDLPLNVFTWKDIKYYLNEQFQEIAYVLAYRVQIKNDTVKQ